MHRLFTEARRNYLKEMATDPFLGVSSELQASIREFAKQLNFWLGNARKSSIRELHKVWKKDSALRKWLSKNVHKSSYILYYGAQTDNRDIQVGDKWKGFRGAQHWSKDKDVSRDFAGLKGRVGSWDKPGAVLVEAHAKSSDVIVDVDQFSKVAGRHHASFAQVMDGWGDAIETFNGTAYEAEVITTSKVKGKVVEVKWYD